MQQIRNIINNLNVIEYFGVNVSNSRISNEKVYYIWDNREFPIDSRLKEFLKPFDFGLRKHGTDFSVSAFVKNVTFPRMQECVYVIKDKYGIVINTDSLNEFYQFQQIPKDIHYDPIISFKYKSGVIEGISLYVTALKDKTLVMDYMEQTILLLLNPSSILASFIRNLVTLRYADMFQIAWDFDHMGLAQHKVYLKIKQLDAFVIEMEKVFPELTCCTLLDGFRFCELAFVIKNKEVKSFNLYFKPL